MASRITRILERETDYTAGTAKSANALIVDNGRLLVAKADIAAGATGSCFVRGVEISVTKASGETWAEGDEVYYDEANTRFTKTAVAGCTYGGLATRDIGSSVTTGYVDLGAAKSNGNDVRSISESVAVGDFTDGGGTSGYIDLDTQLPAGAIPLGFKFTTTGAFLGDTSAVISVGVSGDTDRFASVTDQSVFATGTVGAGVPADACDGMAAAQTVRVTVTTAADFTSCKSNGTGAGTLELFYIATA